MDRSESLSQWYSRLTTSLPEGSMTAYDEVPKDSPWQADEASGRIKRADGRFRQAVITAIDDPLQEVPQYDAPVFLEMGGPGLVLNITRETANGIEMLLQFKGERGQRYVTTTVQASYANLGSNNVVLADVADKAELFERSVDIKQAQDIALAMSGADMVDNRIISPKWNYLSERLLKDSRYDVHALITEPERVRFRWSVAQEVRDLQRATDFAVSSHLSQWLGAYPS